VSADHVKQPKRVVIIGGVAGGASCAARARRLSEESEIIIVERGPHVSFANCGLPYFTGGEIADEKKLLVATPESLRARFNLDVRINTEAVNVIPGVKEVELADRVEGRNYRISYDALVLAVGADPLRPAISGIDRPGHFALRDIPDLQAIMAWIEKTATRRAVVVGGGYIGLEMAEQLVRRGLTVSLVEALPQVMAPLDPEMAGLLHKELVSNGVDLHLGDAVTAFEEPSAGAPAKASDVILRSGTRLSADIVILGLGVRPDLTLARKAGLEIGNRGGIRVDEHLRTSDPHIWAVGDVIEVRDAVTNQWTLMPLAGPANRQGRIAADNIFGRPSRCKGVYGTAILRLFDLSAGCTGSNEKTLQRLGIAYEAVHLHPANHAGYYPGAKPLALKMLFSPETGKVLGAQAVGAAGVDKRIDVFAAALKAGMTVDDVAELELAYAPPFGSAKDPVNLAGMIAQNIMSGDVVQAQWRDVAPAQAAGAVVVDVREMSERNAGHIPGSVHIPLGQLRARINELPRDSEIIVHCQSGQRSYYAARLLQQKGYRVRNLSGSYRTWANAPNR